MTVASVEAEGKMRTPYIICDDDRATKRLVPLIRFILVQVLISCPNALVKLALPVYVQVGMCPAHVCMHIHVNVL